jgi:hypothetical protein
VFDSGRASATKPSRASRLVACATPKTSATYAVAVCFLVSCKGQARSCLTHVCRSERTDLLFVHHSERIGHARRRFVMLRYQAACIIGSAGVEFEHQRRAARHRRALYRCAYMCSKAPFGARHVGHLPFLGRGNHERHPHRHAEAAQSESRPETRSESDATQHNNQLRMLSALFAVDGRIGTNSIELNVVGLKGAAVPLHVACCALRVACCMLHVECCALHAARRRLSRTDLPSCVLRMYSRSAASFAQLDAGTPSPAFHAK